MASPRIDVRRAPKRQGRWWIITLNDREVYREVTAKDARRFARNAHKIPGFGMQPMYNPAEIGIQPWPPVGAGDLLHSYSFLLEPETLGT